MKRKVKVSNSLICLMGLFMLAFVSCNKELNNRLVFEDNVNDLKVAGTEYKIAYFIIEGGVGTIIGKQATDYGAMPTLGKLALNSMFTWNGVSAENKQASTSYADLLTGVEFAKHKVQDAGETNNLSKYPTLYKRIKQYSTNRTALITSNPILSSIAEADAIDHYALVGTDDEVKTQTVEELKKEDASFVLATFNEANLAGKQDGYDSDEYVAALGHIDSKLDELHKTIQSRKNYANEKWLIVIGSDKGGFYELDPFLNDGSVFSDTERNNFTLIYNNQFVYKNIERIETVDPAWTSAAVQYKENLGAAVLPVSESNLYDFGNSAAAGEYTIQLKLKVHEMNGRNGKGGTAQNGIILGKQSSATNFSAGWSITYHGGNGWRFISASGNNAANYMIDGEPFNLNTWYTLTVRIFNVGATRNVSIYRDGKLIQTKATMATQNMSNDTELKLGYKEGSFGNNAGFVHSIADVRIYKVALSEQQISALYCTTLSTPSTDPNHGSLIGYWPANDGGNVLKDKSPNKRHLEVTGEYSWNSFSERSSTLCPTPPDDLHLYVLRTVDVPRTIYNWLNILETGKFDLDAQIWNPSFTKR